VEFDVALPSAPPSPIIHDDLCPRPPRDGKRGPAIRTSGFIVRPDGRKVAYIIDGDLTNAKHVFLCFHGMMSNAKFFKGGAPDGCAYISIDRMGYGKSSYVSPSKFSYSDVVDDAGAIVDKFSLTEVYLMAHSAGSPNALNVASAWSSPDNGPTVKGVGILAGETEYTVEGAPQTPGGVKCFMGGCVGGCCVPVCPCVCDWGFFGDWKLKFLEYPFKVENITCPVILYYAEKDGIIDEKLTQFTAARLKNASVEMIPNTAHFTCATPEFQKKMAAALTK
jgi:pimeloyl-ACP methyl ester carboxylesterase